MTKRDFIENEILILTINGALARGKAVYNFYEENDIADNKKKIDFRNFINDKLKTFKNIYKNGNVNEENHIQNLLDFKNLIDSNYKAILRNGGINFGRAQKLLNLYLKYLWSLGEIGLPPHCPFDSIIISKLDDTGGIIWTDMSLDDYKLLVSRAKEKAGGKSLSDWELEVFGRR
ncbi:MAG: hypothetical protein WC768_03305 [Patescibacteria group bacterium]|jgi:hypothetical protein